MTAFEEQIFRDWWYGDERSGMSHALGILAGSEDGEAVLGRAESFDTLVGLLAVIQSRGHSMN